MPVTTSGDVSHHIREAQYSSRPLHAEESCLKIKHSLGWSDQANAVIRKGVPIADGP